VNIGDVNEKIETRIVEVTNKIIYEDLQTGKYKYVDKKNNLLESVLDHIRCIYGQSEYENIKNNYSASRATPVEIEKNLDNQTEGLYLIKVSDNYELYKKTTEMINNGWIRNNLVPQVKKIKLGKYFEVDL
jgi:hypothetical protein